MPKMKTHRGAAKRFRKTGSGKLMRHRANSNHMFTGKSTKQKRPVRKDVAVSNVDSRRLKQLLPSL
ncbi:MAG: 50S ribosomal protein L35 [Deltaproteobacteria bacterium]|nr:MAG: 50S ribosomal protein L35 [Deltaproteobacteria bacterium]